MASEGEEEKHNFSDVEKGRNNVFKSQASSPAEIIFKFVQPPPLFSVRTFKKEKKNAEKNLQTGGSAVATQFFSRI